VVGLSQEDRDVLRGVIYRKGLFGSNWSTHGVVVVVVVVGCDCFVVVDAVIADNAGHRVSSRVIACFCFDL